MNWILVVFVFWTCVQATSQLSFSVCICNFTSRPDDTYVIVGVAKDMSLNPRSCSTGYLHAYKIVDESDGTQKLDFAHKVLYNRLKLVGSGFFLPSQKLSSCLEIGLTLPRVSRNIKLNFCIVETLQRNPVL